MSDARQRMAARGFQEQESSHSDSSAILRKSLKMYFAVAVNEGLLLRSIDIRAAFLQANGLHFEPPRDVKIKSKIWRLKNLIYD